MISVVQKKQKIGAGKKAKRQNCDLRTPQASTRSHISVLLHRQCQKMSFRANQCNSEENMEGYLADFDSISEQKTHSLRRLKVPTSWCRWDEKSDTVWRSDPTYGARSQQTDQCCHPQPGYADRNWQSIYSHQAALF